MTGRDLAFYQELFDVCTRLMEKLQAIPQPVIAKVHGIATAAGCQLVAACDLAIASDDCRFATPGVKIGLFCSTPMVEVSPGRRPQTGPGTAPDRRAHRRADRRRLGPDQPVRARRRAGGDGGRTGTRIADASPYVVGIGKQAFYQQIDLDKRAAYDYTKGVMSENATAADAQEGICAFLDKRSPQWTGR